MQYSFLESVELSCFCVFALLGGRIPYQEQKYRMYMYDILICFTEYIYVNINSTVYCFVLEEYMHF